MVSIIHLSLELYNCYYCGRIRDINKKENWYLNPPTNLVLCNNCYEYLILNDYYEEKKKRHFKFKDKDIVTKYIPRIGVCNLCRAVVPFDIKRTHIHHEIYDSSDKLKHTIELCGSCHNKRGFEMGLYNKIPENRECYACYNTPKTTPVWQKNIGTEYWLCNRCRHDYSFNRKSKIRRKFR